MKVLRYLGSFHRDHKRITRRGWNLARLEHIVDILRQREPLPPSAQPHPLHGEWRGYWECHIGNDWLLIYKRTDAELILARTGTHADLFE